MIIYFNGCIVLNEVEKNEIKTLYNHGGRKVCVEKDDQKRDQVSIYTSEEGKRSYVLAMLYGATAEALYYLALATPSKSLFLKEIIDKYCD